MNVKIAVLVAVAVMMVGGIAVLDNSEDDDAIDPFISYTITLVTDSNYMQSLPAGQTTVSVRPGEVYGTLPTPTMLSGYTFAGWYTQQGEPLNPVTWGTHVTSSTGYRITYGLYLYAQCNSTGATTTYWSNGTTGQDLYNGSVEIGFHFTSALNYTHIMTYSLWQPTVSADGNTTTWANTNGRIEVSADNYPSTTIHVKVAASTGTMEKTYEPGSWSSFSITVDTENGAIWFTPFYKFVNFSDYQKYDPQLILDMSDKVSGLAVKTITHKDGGTGTVHPSFSVLNTRVFLNTYGVVMKNPSINVHDYFPNYTSVRLSIPSVAVYGTSMTVNGNTFTLDGVNISFYVKKNATTGIWEISSQGTTGAVQKTFELTNFSVSWSSGVCSLTFHNDNYTVSLGSFTAGSWTVSFGGIWYFSASLYEPKTVTEMQLSGDWKNVPDLDGNTILLLFVGILMLLGIIARLKLDAKWLDLVVMGGAVVIAYMLLR